MRVLLIEDDSAMAQSIELMLKVDSFNVYTTDLGEEGIDLGKVYDYDIILLDLNLPDMSGLEVLRSLRVARINTPILILTGLATVEDKVRGFEFGADDYLTKPFHRAELVARIHAIVRRSKGHAGSVIQTGDLIVNLDNKAVEINGARVYLTDKEYQMLELLTLRKDITITKDMFLNHLYGGMDEPEGKIIDVFICKLRTKPASASGGNEFIETVWGRGHVLREPATKLATLPTAAYIRPITYKRGHTFSPGRPTVLFKERLIYEQSAARTVREQQEKRSCGWSRQPLKIEQLCCNSHREVVPSYGRLTSGWQIARAQSVRNSPRSG